MYSLVSTICIKTRNEIKCHQAEITTNAFYILLLLSLIVEAIVYISHDYTEYHLHLTCEPPPACVEYETQELGK